jgi:hypothetical protein
VFVCVFSVQFFCNPFIAVVVLLDANSVCKICDFGMSRLLLDTELSDKDRIEMTGWS